MTTYNEGDLIEAVKTEIASSTRFRGVLAMVENANRVKGLVLKAQGYEPMMQWLEDRGFEFTLIEKAAPKLPTEPGTMITWRDGAYLPQIAQLDAGKARMGWRFGRDIGGDWYTPERLEKEIDGNTFTRLEPVPVTAKKVIEALGEYLDGQLTGRTKDDIIAAMAEEFGVTR